MRRRLRKFLPIVLIALTVQIFAPIAACWAASIAASDPLGAALICSGGGGSAAGHTGQTGDRRVHDGACSICCVAHAGASADTPQIAVLAVPRACAGGLARARTGPVRFQNRFSRPSARATVLFLTL